MSRIVSLDVGDVRIGVAVCDDLGLSVNPVRTITRTKSVKADLREIELIVDELGAERVVVGLPLNTEGEYGPQALKVRDFTERLTRRLRIPVILWDESFSTTDAETMMIEAGLSRERRKKVIDQMAAVIILQSYLESIEKKEKE